MEVEALSHLLILCCYGGLPYIDYQQLGNNIKHESTMSLDPTDWIAIDSSGSLLNNTIHPEILSQNPSLSLLIPPNTALDQCDLYNLTFSSAGDEHLYELGHGKLSCRCPLSRTGVACQTHSPNLPQALALSASSSSSNSNMGSDPFASYMLASIFLMVAMILLFFSMMKGCFCDCFGGLQNPFKRNTDEPLDPVAISRCLHAVNEYEEKQKQGYPDQVNRPLISSVSENFAAPYNDTVYPPPSSQYPSAPRSSSPPPSYRSQNGSMEYLPGVTTAKTQL